jgi:hypothetical protein
MAEIEVPSCFNSMLSLTARKAREAWVSTYIQRSIQFAYLFHVFHLSESQFLVNQVKVTCRHVSDYHS